MLILNYGEKSGTQLTTSTFACLITLIFIVAEDYATFST